MLKVHTIAFNPFQENTYIVFDNSSKKAVIIDPGCYSEEEENVLKQFIENNQLTPVMLINTHCHIDHILGNKFVSDCYNLDLQIHAEEMYNLKDADNYGRIFDLPVANSPAPEKFLQDGQIINLGNSNLEVRHTPGHSKGHITLISHEDNFIICGDVLFHGSIGRTDLPGGNFDTIMESLFSLLNLGDDYKVYPGHGIPTTIGNERRTNPFLTD